MQFLNSVFPLGLFVGTALAFVIVMGTASAQVPEPQGYRMGPLHSEVPATLTEAKV